MVGVATVTAAQRKTSWTTRMREWLSPVNAGTNCWTRKAASKRKTVLRL